MYATDNSYTDTARYPMQPRLRIHHEVRGQPQAAG